MSTAQSVIYNAFKMLAQTTDSGEVAAGLFGGASEAGSPVISGIDQALFWVTEGQNRLARLCMPIQDYAATQAPSAGAQSLLPYGSIISPSRRILHTATELWIGNRQLTPASAGYLRRNGWYPSALNGDPTAWSTNSGTAIGLSYYSTRPWFGINGYFLPAPLTALTQELDANIDDYAEIALWSYLGWRLAISNQDNTVLFERAVPCMNQFVEAAREIYTRLIQNDSNLSAIFTAQNIDAQVQSMKQLTLKT